MYSSNDDITYVFLTRSNVIINQYLDNNVINQCWDDNFIINQLWDDNKFNFRLKLFNKFTYSSIKNQKTNIKYFWIINIDPNIPLEREEKIKEIIKNDNNFFVIKSKIPPNTDQIGQIIGGINTTYLVTIRLDDDDALNINYLAQLHDYICKHKKEIHDICIISYYYGFYLKIDDNFKIISYKRKRSKLIALGLALVTRVKEYPLTIYQLGNHKRIHEVYLKNTNLGKTLLSKMYSKNNVNTNDINFDNKVIYIGTPNMWIRTIHSCNLSKSDINSDLIWDPKFFDLFSINL